MSRKKTGAFQHVSITLSTPVSMGKIMINHEIFGFSLTFIDIFTQSPCIEVKIIDLWLLLPFFSDGQFPFFHG